MPTETVSLSDPNPASKVLEKIEQIEATGGELIGAPTVVGDQWLIVYKQKPRVGRPPKETRG